MTAPTPPPEIVEKAWRAVQASNYLDPDYRTLHDDVRVAVAAVYGDIVAERDAEIERLRERSIGLRAAELAYDEARARRDAALAQVEDAHHDVVMVMEARKRALDLHGDAGLLSASYCRVCAVPMPCPTVAALELRPAADGGQS